MYVGVDGCRNGWFAIRLHEGAWDMGVYPNIAELMNAYKKAELVLIDIPIGLPSDKPRLCDGATRRKLTRLRASSVFPVPGRKAVYAETYEQACELNSLNMGRKLSKQAWNICPKIKEVDKWLQAHPEAWNKLREAHPELAFWAVGGGVPMSHYKKSEEGKSDRLALLREKLPYTDTIYQEAMESFPRKILASDDILDAMILALSARYPEHLNALPENPEPDETGLPMEIVFCEFFIKK